MENLNYYSNKLSVSFEDDESVPVPPDGGVAATLEEPGSPILSSQRRRREEPDLSNVS